MQTVTADDDVQVGKMLRVSCELSVCPDDKARAGGRERRDRQDDRTLICSFLPHIWTVDYHDTGWRNGEDPETFK
jgi:hypothetical protein